MEFRTEAQKNCYQKIQPIMQELFGEFAMKNDSIPQFGMRVGSALAVITVYPWGDDDSFVRVQSVVVQGPEITPELTLYLLKENADLLFGAFGIDDDGDITFEHSLVGSTCDKEELKATVLAVVNSADKYDDEIVQRWGGKRADD